ncbi:uncharacterized protein TNCV_933191 [Trichonephila clavipes]|nr:uncharacterized protein TNCV_933191 [Trichonephila clavipes]
MITNFFIPELNNHDVQELWFQQDGATCHTARATIDLLKDTFADHLISRFGPVNWPPRSCDLTLLDYFFANRSSRIFTGGKVRAAKRQPRISHICSMGLRSGDHAGQSIRSISSPSKSCSAATVRWHGALSSMKRNCRTIVPLKRRTYGRRISLQ